MKKLIFCSYSCVYSSLVLQKILENSQIEVVAIINSTRILHPEYGALKGSLKQIQQSGWRYSSYLFFITDLFSWGQAFFSLKKSSLKTIQQLARQHKIPIINTKNINTPESVDYIRKLQADFLLAAHFNQLIKPEILEIEQLQCLNIHPSLLPSFKGVDPVFYAMLKNKKTLGVSLHRMSERFDSGEILLQDEIHLDNRQNSHQSRSTQCLFSINCKLFSKGAELAVAWINKMDKTQNQTRHTTCKNNEGDYDSWPGVADIDKFRQSKKKLLCLSDYLRSVLSGRLP